MKKLTYLILCLALISLACLDTGTAMLEPVQTATHAPTLTETATLEAARVATGVPTEELAELCAMVSAATAQNLRELPESSSRILGHLRSGEVVQVIDKQDPDWWHVRRGVAAGFARSVYLQVVECVK